MVNATSSRALLSDIPNAVALQITPYVSTAFYWLSVLCAEEKCRHLEQSRKALIVGVHAIGQ